MRYTIYVFQSTVTRFNDVLAPGKREGRFAYKRISVTGVQFEAEAFLQTNKETPPGWLKQVAPYCDVPPMLRNRSSSLIVAIRTRNGTICAVTHGQGFQSLDRTKIVEECGLDLAQRILRPGEIKAMDSIGVGDGSLQKRHVASRTSDLDGFPINPFRDRVKRIEGRTSQDGLGTRFSGGTSCVVTGAVTFPELGNLCEAIVAARTNPKIQRLAATTPYQEVKDPHVTKALRAKLLKELMENEAGAIGAFLPDIEDWSRIAEFRLKYGRLKPAELEDLDPVKIAERLSNLDDDGLDLAKVRISGLDDDGREVFREPFERLATFETSYRSCPYALSDGKWYMLSNRFIESVADRASEIPVLVSGEYLPCWSTQDRKEGDYNKRVGRECRDRFCCLDTQNIVVDGRGPIEPCDLVSADGHFVHVKKWTSSQRMSALIKQGENAALVTRRHQDFRDQILAKLPSSWRARRPWQDFSAGFKAGNHCVVFAVPDAPHRNLPQDLPIFSRLSLIEACSRLRAENFNVALVHVPLES